MGRTPHSVVGQRDVAAARALDVFLVHIDIVFPSQGCQKHQVSLVFGSGLFNV